MNITQHPGDELLELRLTGRLDATWADHVSGSIEAAVKGGAHHILLNFTHVDFISSLGIRVLINHYKRLQAVKGSLAVIQPSEAALAVLKAAGLAALLVKVHAPAVTAASTPRAAKTLTRDGVTYQVFPQTGAAPLTCSVVGTPARLSAGGFTDADSRPLHFKAGTFGLGLGAFGEGFADCRGRYGEFLAAGGCAVTLPTNDPHARPDYLIEEGTLVPEVHALYALVGRGDFSDMVRFDPAADGPGAVGISALVDALLDISGGQAAAFVVLAESAGIVGATLRQSPAISPASLELPGIRDWLSFTTERASEPSLALIVGVAAREVPPDAAPFLRSMKADLAVQAHLHAAVFPYRPVQRGEMPFGTTVADILTSSAPSTVMHLMADLRPFEGVGETDLVRGACWTAPLGTISRA